MAKTGGMLNAICAKLLRTTHATAGHTAEHYLEDQEASVDADVKNNNTPVELKEPVTGDQETRNNEKKTETPIQEILSADAFIPREFSSNTGRKSRRKNFAPRSIAHLHEDTVEEREEIEQFEIDVRKEDVIHVPFARSNGKFDAQTGDSEEVMALDLSSNASTSYRESESLATSSSSIQIEPLAAEEYTMDMVGALDLTVSKTPKSCDTRDNTFTQSTDQVQRSDELAAVTCERQTFKTANLPPVSFTPNKDKTSDASDIKNYAENTVNELLSLYGLGKQEAESITESVSLEHFSAGSILARHMTPPPQHLQAAALAAAVERAQKKSDAATAGRKIVDPGLSKSKPPSAPSVAQEAIESISTDGISKVARPAQGKNLVLFCGLSFSKTYNKFLWGTFRFSAIISFVPPPPFPRKLRDAV